MQGVGHAHKATSDSVDLLAVEKAAVSKKESQADADAREGDLYRSAVVNEEIGQAKDSQIVFEVDLRLSDNGAVCHARISDYCWIPKRRILEGRVELVKLKRREEKKKRR